MTKAFEERPQLILLDVMMPDMDGYEVTRRLRKNPATAAIPILMFTAKTQLDDKVTGFEVGADDYLTKPTHPTELQSHVKALLARATPKSPEDMATVSQERHGYVIGVVSERAGWGLRPLPRIWRRVFITAPRQMLFWLSLLQGREPWLRIWDFCQFRLD
ncbi:MAG: response regulator [Anaerolineales bacterium]|nr:response regulator [Anaerolineales bacterium]